MCFHLHWHVSTSAVHKCIPHMLGLQAQKTSGNALKLAEATFPRTFQEYVDR